MIPIHTKPEGLIKEILDQLDAGAIKEAAIHCRQLVQDIYQGTEKPHHDHAELLLQELRSLKQFGWMQSIADALIQMNCSTFRIRRQYAQALLDTDHITAAFSVLASLQQDTMEADGKEAATQYKEAKGLEGRGYKQLYIRSGNPTFLKQAIACYTTIYEADPEHNLWHGINLVALLYRAERDGINIEDYLNPEDVAESIIYVIEQKYEDQAVNVWDFATAAEACIALNRIEDALQWLSGFTRMPDINAFELSSTLRQLEEVWQLTTDSEAGSLILPVLRAELLKKEGGHVVIHVDQLLQEKEAEAINTEIYQSLADEDVRDGMTESPVLERVFGDDSFKTYKWYMSGADRCLSVARIGRDASQGHGTGFLLRGGLLHEKLGDELVVVTNAHVISNDTHENALRPEEVTIIFEALDRDMEFTVSELIFTSPSHELDVSIVRFDAENQERLKELTKDVNIYRVASLLPRLIDGDKQTQRIYIIGHPGGGTLQLSFQDNALLDHQDPKIHYRTPTEGGSSGSPVFNEQWELVGLHHAGSRTLPKLNGKKGTYEANEGIWIKAIKNALSAVL